MKWLVIFKLVKGDPDFDPWPDPHNNRDLLNKATSQRGSNQSLTQSEGKKLAQSLLTASYLLWQLATSYVMEIPRTCDAFLWTQSDNVMKIINLKLSKKDIHYGVTWFMNYSLTEKKRLVLFVEMIKDDVVLAFPIKNVKERAKIVLYRSPE